MSDAPVGKQPLDGIRVVDFSQVLAGPACTAMLGALGAEVIRVESRAHLDGTRVPGGVFSPTAFHLVNHNKRSVTLNLRSDEGRSLATRLIAISDLVMESFRPGVLDRLGLGYAALRALKPNLLMISISANGQAGPEAHFGAYAAIFAALGGLSYLTGYSDGFPTEWRGSVDHRVGVAAFGACLAGLLRLSQTGQGGHIDLSGREVQTTLIGDAVLEAQLSALSPGPMGNDDRIMAPHGCFPSATADTWVTIAVGSDAEWSGFCKATGSRELEHDPGYGDGFRRWRHGEELNSVAAEWVALQQGEAAVTRMQMHGVPASLSLRMDQLARDEHLRSRGLWRQLNLPATARDAAPSPPTVSLAGAPWIFNGSRDMYQIEPAPELGEGNEDVFLGHLGLSRDQYDRLVADGVIT